MVQAFNIILPHNILYYCFENWKEMNYRLCDQEEFTDHPCCAAMRVFGSAPFRLVVIAMLGK